MTAAQTGGRLRLFVAVDVPPHLLTAVEEAIAPYRSELTQARWVPRQNQHVTLKFIGWVADHHEGAVRARVEETAAAHGRATLSLEGFGCFPSRRRARVLWVGLADPARLLEALAGGLDRAFEPLGVPREERSFVPHLTLARFKQPQTVPDLPEPLQGERASFEVSRLSLYRSHLSPRGARYEALATFPLAP